MPTRLNDRRWLVLGLLPLLMYAGCATNSPPPPPEIGPGLRLTPPPASTTKIDLSDSAAWQEKARSYLSKLRAFSQNATPQ